MYCISIKYKTPNNGKNGKKNHYGYIGINSGDRPTFTDTINSKIEPLKLFATRGEAYEFWEEWKHLFSEMILIDVKVVEITLIEEFDLLNGTLIFDRPHSL